MVWWPWLVAACVGAFWAGAMVGFAMFVGIVLTSLINDAVNRRR